MNTVQFNEFIKKQDRQLELLTRIAEALAQKTQPLLGTSQIPTGGYLPPPNLFTMQLPPPGMWARKENGFLRRQDILLFSPAEQKLYDMVHYVESLGAHPLLTDAVILLTHARSKIADWVELEEYEGAEKG